MKSEAKAKYLVVDTTGFIRNVQFQELAENVITLEDVVNEIKCQRQLKRLAVLPYDLIIKSVFPENIKTVTEFSKKTGDYPSLSAVDMKVMAMTYQLEKENVGIDHINTSPETQTTIENYDPSSISFDNIAGFYHKDKVTDENDVKSLVDGDELTNNLNELDICGGIAELSNIKGEIILSSSEIKQKFTDTPEIEEKDYGTHKESELIEYPQKSLSSNENLEIDDNFEHSNDISILKRINEEAPGSDDVSDDDSIYDDDECGWITPGNIMQAKRESTAGILSDEPVTVACLTTDFAMQNVLMQMGLNVMSIDGRIIKQVRTYILRCHACGKTTSIMTKVFCPKCGLRTLKRVAVTLDPDGKQHIYINYKRQITARGKRWSIPRPQGGKHANNPILVEDQRVPQQRLSKKARQRTNALDPDYIAGFSPFVMKDTTSRSIMLGFHTSRQNVKHLIDQNPNKRKGKKKK